MPLLQLHYSYYTMFESQEWKNEFLSWNPNDYCGIEDVLIPNNNFWLPDLYIYEM